MEGRTWDSLQRKYINYGPMQVQILVARPLGFCWEILTVTRIRAAAGLKGSIPEFYSILATVGTRLHAV